MTKNLKHVLHELANIFRFILPRGRSEVCLFLFLLIFYSLYSIPIALESQILDFQMMAHDLFFSYDNVVIYHLGHENLIGHPFFIIISKPFMLIGTLLYSMWGAKGKTVFFVVACSVLIVLSNVYVFRYLRRIVGLINLHSYLLTVFFAFFSTNLILCFTFESFTLSAFLISLAVCFFSYSISQNKKMSLTSTTFFALSLGGTTITNFAIGIFPIIFGETDRRVIVKRILIIGSLFTFLLLAAYLYYGDSHFSPEKMSYRLTSFMGSSQKYTPLSYIFHSFAGIPILMADLNHGTYIHFFEHTFITFAGYKHIWQYVFSILVSLICVCAIIMNYKNRHVLILASILGLSVLIHLIVGYGAHEGFYIYGAHWVCVVPLLFGWLYKSLKSTKLQYLFLAITVGLVLTLIVNNAIVLEKFIQLVFEFYSIDKNLIVS